MLSELPGAWKQAVTRWARLNRRARAIVDDASFPSRNAEYLLYQTLVGSWPLEPLDPAGERAYADRIVEYMRKAMREAKVVTSWLNPRTPHEEAMEAFVRTILDPANGAFRRDFLTFQRPIARWGLYNSLAQLTVTIGAPGIPDLYQGIELWDFRLVDPDNRRQALLESVVATSAERRNALLQELITQPQDDRLKLLTMATLLRWRREHERLFREGPAQVDGDSVSLRLADVLADFPVAFVDVQS